MVRLQFPHTDVREVLGFYERLTNKHVIMDNQVQAQVNIVTAGEIPTEEAIRIIEINLMLNGITLIPVEHSKLVKVIGAGKNPRSNAIPIISDEMLLPSDDQVVTYIAKLNFADPTELQQTLTAFVGQSQGGYTNFTALPKAQTLLITENSAEVRNLLHIIREIDVPPAEVMSEFISLKRADAADVLDKLKAIFEKKESGPGALATPAGGANAAAAAAAVRPQCCHQGPSSKRPAKDPWNFTARHSRKIRSSSARSNSPPMSGRTAST